MTQTEIINSQKYSISLAEFLGEKPENLESFDWKKVSRNNFMHWYELSFRISQGEPDAQLLFFYWCEQNLGFDFKSTLDNLSEASSKSEGGWDFLSDDERLHLFNSYRHLERHREIEWEENRVDIEKYTSDEILDRAEAQTDFIEANNKRMMEKDFPMHKELKGMPAEAFKTRIRNEIRELKERIEGSREKGLIILEENF